jgi:hypothetical protein
MSEARKCDRCHGFYDIAEEQQDRKTPYEFKGDYINLHLWVARHGIPKDVMSQWYDLCPKCMMELECWLNNNEFPTICEHDKDTDCADRSNGATEKELELASKLNNAKFYIAQLKNELGYAMTKEEIELMKDVHNFTDEDISEAAKFVETKPSSEEYKDPCKSCHNCHCEQCDYGYCSDEEKKKRWVERHKKETKLSDPYEDGGL